MFFIFVQNIIQFQSQHSDRDVSSPMSVDSHDTDGLKDEEEEEEEDEEAKKAKVRFGFTSLNKILSTSQRTFYEKNQIEFAHRCRSSWPTTATPLL